MKLTFRYIAFLYLFLISLALLLPLDIYLIEENVINEQQPSKNEAYIIHLVIFFFLYLFFYLSFENKYKIFFYCFFYAILIELFQNFTSRSFQFLDIIFNILGLLFSLTFLRFLEKKAEHH